MYLLEGLFLEVVSDNISRGMRIISCQDPSQLFLQLLLSELELIWRFDELSWAEIVTVNIIIVSITKTVFILNKIYMYKYLLVNWIVNILLLSNGVTIP